MDSGQHSPPPVEGPFLDESTLDMLLCMLLIFLVVLVLEKPIKPLDAEPEGEIVVAVFWPDGWNTDVDLWVRAPQGRPVGYANTHGVIFDHVRDDLGMVGDPRKENQEKTVSRGAPQGEYIVNLHLYSDARGDLPVPVTVRVTIRPRRMGEVIQIFEREVLLQQVGQEITVNRFSLDREGFPIPGSVHDLPKKLRT